MRRRIGLAASVTCVCLLSFRPLVSGGAATEPAASAVAPVVGAPETVSPGITETVDQIIARDAAAPASSTVGTATAAESAPLQQANGVAPVASRWPVPDGKTAASPPAAPDTVGTSFKAIGLSESGFIPPDTAGAVGATQVLVHTNGRVRAFAKTGAPGALNVAALSFWASVANGSQPIYPQVRYDRLSARFILLAVNSAKPNNRILIAVQTTPGTITGSSSFTFYQFSVSSGGGGGDNSNVCDSPKLGVDANALYVGCNMLANNGTLSHITVYVVRKSSVIPAPGTLVVTAFRNISGNNGPGPFGPVGVDNDDPLTQNGYFIGTDIATSGLLQLRRVTDPGGTPSLSGNITLTVPTTAPPILQPASGSTVSLDAGDGRLSSASFHKNKLTGAVTLSVAHGTEVDATCTGTAGGGRNGLRWYEISATAPTAADPLAGSPSLLQAGTLCDPSSTNPQGYIFPSVAFSGQGDMVLAGSTASTSLFAGAAAAGRLRTAAAGSTSSASAIQTGLSSYTFTSGGHNRWGDYSFTDVDPSDDQTIWTFQEYADSTANNWAVRAVQMRAPPPPTLTGTQVALCLGAPPTLITLTGTAGSPVDGSEFFDPGGDSGGPGYASRLSATVTGGVNIVGSPAIVLPASPQTQRVMQVTMTVDISGATAGNKNITVKNPDGQATTGVGILEIDAPSTPASTNNGPVCIGGTLQLNVPSPAAATVDYSWTGPNGFTSTLQNPTIENVTAAAAGTYTVTFSGTGCAIPPASTNVVVLGEGAACQDGNACTSGDSCHSGVCQPGPAVVCNDNNACTADSCNPATGCVFTDVSATLCDDGNVCTDDLCSPATGCFHRNNAAPCNDGNACTTNDTCSHQACHGTAISCNDGNACTTDTCNPASGCVHTDNSAACNDNNVCTVDTCNPASGCVHTDTTATACNDANVCTNDLCDPVTGCYHTPASGSCDDGNACTRNDACGGGTCQSGPPIVCDDGNACTADSCNPSTGCVFTDVSATLCDDHDVCTDDSCNPATGCVHTNNTAPCNDGNACTTGDACSAGTCQPGGATHCDDGNPCTDDSCNPATGCVHTPNTAPCDDGNACTTNDTCGDGTCHGGPPLNCDDGFVCTDDLCFPSIGCVHGVNTAPCDDGNACTENDVCSFGVCQPGTPIVCDDGNPCTDDYCYEDTGCDFEPNLADCDDGNACTTGDTCANGVCQGGTVITCDDGNPCTVDSCNPASGCVFAPNACDDGNPCTDDTCDPQTGCAHADNTAPCNDGNACTAGDTCGAGTCHPGTAVFCDDGNACTADSCTPSTGCVFVDISASCDDGNACTADSCHPATGCAHVDISASCDDGNPCTDDSCNPSTGCVHTPNTAPCDDGNSCTTGDTCGAGACQAGTAIVCDDGSACTADTCDPATGCVFTDISASCDDGNPCTDDSCDPATGCVHTNNTVPCNDNNACTAGDTCGDGSCQPGAAVNCDDGNACTADSCHPATGCAHVDISAACDDGNACTADSCHPATGCVHLDISASCNDGNVCTDDLCDPASGCQHVANTAPCDDGDFCTTGDTCGGGVCHAGTVPLECDDANACTGDSCDAGIGCIHVDISASCNDGNVCTDDHCDPATGCVHTDNTAPCNDGNACTTGDTCAGGSCQPGTAVVCNDDNACTADSCRPSTGCVFTDISAACDDGNACTADSCHPSTGCAHVDISASCDDGNVCTDDSCNPATGCVHTPNSASCDDGNVCTLGDTCGGGTCHAGAVPLTCDDGNACTADTCNPATGCVFTDISASCDDGNVCTDDGCNPATGCVHTNNTASCNDGNACTAGDTCAGGSCQSGAAIVCNDDNVCTTDSCNPATGCVFTNVTAVLCNDGNVCTNDLCDPSSGCFHTFNTASCDDGNPCTGGDACSAGVCSGAPLPVPEVSGVTVSGHATTTVAWLSVALPSSYDVAAAALSDLHGSGVTGAACLANDVAGTSTVDSQSAPQPGAGYGYLIRAQGTCGTGTYGFASSGLERSIQACP